MNHQQLELPTGALVIAAIKPWMEEQRQQLRKRGRSLNTAELQALQGYFSSTTLDSIIVCSIQDFTALEPPSFYVMLQQQQGALPIDLTRIIGLTLIDTIIIKAEGTESFPCWLAILFQQCVHVVQYKVLGLDGFLHAYWQGWLEHGMTHETIPLEEEAEFLKHRFVENPRHKFSVEQAVAHRHHRLAES